MVTISHLTKKEVNNMPSVYECMSRGLINYPALAKKIKPKIEKELKRKVKLSAIVMSLRRYAEQIEYKNKSKKIFDAIRNGSELTLKSNIFNVCVYNSPTIFGKIDKIKSLINYRRGDIINIVYGNSYISILANMDNQDRILEILLGEEIVINEPDLVMLSFKFPIEYIYTPGIANMLTNELVWSGINIIEIVSSATELNFFIKEEKSAVAYSVLQELLKG